jgi:alpha-ketoglutarate-dependent taurine dioxygenase
MTQSSQVRNDGAIRDCPIGPNRRGGALPDLKPILGCPLLLEVETNGLSAVRWAEEYRHDIQRLIEINGAVLIRGLQIPGSTQFGNIVSTLFGSQLLEYKYRSTPRTELRGHVYTATEYPATEVIPQHNENSYSRTWPNRIAFTCMVAPTSGGETPIADSRAVYNMLPKSIRDKFEEKGVMYVRNYSVLDLPWPVVFQTEDKSAVEAYCKANAIEYEWREDDTLRTSQVNHATTRHPRTGEMLWFNQAHLFHVSNLGQETAASLLSSLREENLPRNCYYGDGSALELEVLDIIRATYEEAKRKFTWLRNDLLLLDNMLFSHGREAYTGPRKVLVGLACPNQRSE